MRVTSACCLVRGLGGPILLVLLGASAASAAAAEPGPTDEARKTAKESSKSKKAKPAWSWDLDLGFEGEYGSNVFLLSDRSIDRFKANDPADVTSGRFDDMSEVDDYVVTGDLELRVRGDGLAERRLEGWLGVEYDQAVHNEVRSHPRFQAGLSQALGKGRVASLAFEYALDRFKRNYLFGSVPNPGPAVSPSERRYSAGTFDTAEIVASFERPLRQRSKKQPSRLDEFGLRRIEGKARLGYGRRDYDHFSNRNRDELIVGAGLEARVGKRWRVDVDYGLGSIFTSRNREFLIIDETDVGVDLNGDLDATDPNVPTFQRVDRSRLDHTAGLEVRWAGPKRIVAKAGYEFTFQDYFSDERFDLSYNGRSDKRHSISGELEWGFAKGWVAAVRGGWFDESSNRQDVRGDPEESSYGGYKVSFGITRRFF